MKEPGYHVLVDGYNVINRYGAWGRSPLAQARHALMALLHATRWPVPVRRVEVVFDAARQVAVASDRVGDVRARFVVPSADAYIQHAVRTSAHPQRLIVMSDDRAILHTAARYGTLRFSSAWLFDRSLPTTQKGMAEEEHHALTGTEKRHITEELAMRWGLR